MLKSEAPIDTYLVAVENGHGGDASSLSKGSPDVDCSPDNLTVDSVTNGSMAPNGGAPKRGEDKRGDYNRRGNEANAGKIFATIWLLLVRAW